MTEASRQCPHFRLTGAEQSLVATLRTYLINPIRVLFRVIRGTSRGLRFVVDLPASQLDPLGVRNSSDEVAGPS